jgi:hypothetical protein
VLHGFDPARYLLYLRSPHLVCVDQAELKDVIDRHPDASWQRWSRWPKRSLRNHLGSSIAPYERSRPVGDGGLHWPRVVMSLLGCADRQPFERDCSCIRFLCVTLCDFCDSVVVLSFRPPQSHRDHTEEHRENSHRRKPVARASIYESES